MEIILTVGSSLTPPWAYSRPMIDLGSIAGLTDSSRSFFTVECWFSEPATSLQRQKIRRMSPIFYFRAQPEITRCSSRTPSVSAAGPGCRMIEDFTS